MAGDGFIEHAVISLARFFLLFFHLFLEFPHLLRTNQARKIVLTVNVYRKQILRSRTHLNTWHNIFVSDAITWTRFIAWERDLVIFFG